MKPSPALTRLPMLLFVSAQALACSSGTDSVKSNEAESSLCPGPDCDEPEGAGGGGPNASSEGEAGAQYEATGGGSGQGGEGGATQLACTMIGCGPALDIDLSLSLGFEAIQALGIEICRNDSCLAGTLAELREPTRAGEGYNVLLDPGDGETHPFAEASIWLGEVDGYQLEVTWWPYSHAALQNGDRYLLTLTQDDGTQLVQVDETVEYEETYPNGVECDVTPCRSAAFEVAL